MTTNNTKERFTGVFEPSGSEVSVTREWGGHRFSDEEVEQLLQGEELSLTLISQKTKNPYDVILFLGENTLDNGKTYFGVCSKFPAKVPNQFGGYVFSDEEKEALENGESLHLTGLRSKANKEYDATIKFGEREDGSVGILFDNNY